MFSKCKALSVTLYVTFRVAQITPAAAGSCRGVLVCEFGASPRQGCSTIAALPHFIAYLKVRVDIPISVAREARPRPAPWRPRSPIATCSTFGARPSEPARRWIWPGPRQRGRWPSRAAPASAGEGTLASRHPCHPTPADTGRVTSTPPASGTAHPALSRQLLRTIPCQRWHGGWSTTGLTRRRPRPAGEGAPVRRVTTRRRCGPLPAPSPPHQPGFNPAAPLQALQGPPRRWPG
jgi:hypothetical protein